MVLLDLIWSQYLQIVKSLTGFFFFLHIFLCRKKKGEVGGDSLIRLAPEK